jgi:hypothetical protein
VVGRGGQSGSVIQVRGRCTGEEKWQGDGCDVFLNPTGERKGEKRERGGGPAGARREAMARGVRSVGSGPVPAGCNTLILKKNRIL